MSKNEHAVFGQDDGEYPWISKVQNTLVGQSVRRHFPKVGASVRLLDVGCGYDARVLRDLYGNIASGAGLDFEVNEVWKKDPKLTFYEGDLNEVMQDIPSESFDMIIFLSILEHLDHPLEALTQARRLLSPGGRVFFCTPTWFGKWVLENVSFRFFDPHGSIRRQVDTHKMYYDLKDMWPMLVKAGFVTSEIKIWRSNLMCSISGYAEKKNL